MTQDQSKTVVFSSKSRMRRPREFLLLAFNDLATIQRTSIRLFAQTLAQRYRYSSLGLLWAVAPALVTWLALTVGQKAGVGVLSKGEVSPAFFGVLGLSMAQTFLDGFNSQRTLFTTNRHLLCRHNVPLEGLISAAVIDGVFNMLIRFSVLALAMAFCRVIPAVTLPVALSGFVGLLILGSGLGLFIAPFTALKRDFDHIMVFLPWILFMTTPVFFPGSRGSGLSLVHSCNPLTFVFNSIRSMTYGATGSAEAALSVFPIGAGVLIFAWLACRLWRPYVIERSLG